jgi:plastocyanin
MRSSIVLLAIVAMACGGGGGGDGYTTGPGTGPGPGAGSGGPGTPSPTASVAMRQSDDGYGTATFSFAPAAVTVAKGGTVTWTNEAGSTAHNVTFAQTAGAPANVGNMTTGSASRTFNTSGSYSYQCTNHSGMTGTVTVP